MSGPTERGDRGRGFTWKDGQGGPIYGAKAPLYDDIGTASNSLAFRLYSQLRDKPGNIFFSPLSLATAWAMAREGAKGETAAEIDKVFGFSAEDNFRRSGFTELCTKMSGADKKPYELMMANALWARYSALETFNRVISEVYRGEVGTLDVARINAWVRQHTNGKIPKIIESIDPLTRLILTNAVYFKGTWVTDFAAKNTRKEAFKKENGERTMVDMMHVKAGFGYAEQDDIQVLSMPYVGNDLAMLVLLPREVGLERLEGMISAEKLTEWCGMMRSSRITLFSHPGSQVIVSLPRFKLEAAYDLVSVFRNMGLHLPFNPTADFSGINGGAEELFVSDVLHRAYVDVNEKGTEAAAATAIVMATLGGGSPKPKIFNADHPFMFAIVDKASGSILFLGKVENPTLV